MMVHMEDQGHVVSGDVTYLKCVYGVSCKLVPRSLSVADLSLRRCDAGRSVYLVG